MTNAHTSAQLPTVQTRKRTALPRRECRPAKRVTYRNVMALAVGASMCDPAVAGLTYRRQAGKGGGNSAVYAVFRWTDPLTKKRGELRLGVVPTEADLSAMAQAHSEALYYEHGLNGIGIVVDGDAVLGSFRAKARKHRGKVLLGQDPRNEMGAEGYTLRQLMSMHTEAMRKANRSERSIEDFEYFLKRYATDWLDLPARRLTRDMLEKRHDQIGRKAFRVGKKLTGGKVTANKVMRYIRAALNEGVARNDTLPEDARLSTFPIKFPWYAEQRTNDAIPLEALPTWFSELAAMQNEVKRDYYLLSVLTGVRRDSVSSIRREHVNLEARTLHIPKPKGGEARAYTIPLSDAALAVVKRRLEAIGEDGEWLFPSTGKRKSKSGHISEPRPETWDGFTVPFRVKSLRNTFISAGHDAGVNVYRVKQLANHKIPLSDVHGGYTRREVEALRGPAQAITDYLRDMAGKAWAKLGLPVG